MLASEHQAMLRHDEHHWWYRGRRRVLRATIERLPLPAGTQILDAGCGSGRTLDELARYGTVAGVDLSADAVAAARARGHADVHQGRIEQLPFADERFDLITCLDVIEHTPDDRVSLAELRRVTRRGGLLIVTVPAYPALWSRHDVVNLHYRRYQRRALHAAAGAAGWSVVWDTYFNSALLAPAGAVRWAQRLHPGPAGRSDLELTPPGLNRVLEAPIAAESRILAHGTRVPAGLSLLSVLRRRVRDVDAGANVLRFKRPPQAPAPGPDGAVPTRLTGRRSTRRCASG